MKIGISRNTAGPDGAAELVQCAKASGFGGIQFKTAQLRAWNFDANVLDQFDARTMARGGVVFHPNTDFSTWPDITANVLRFAMAAGAEHVCYCFCPQVKNGHTIEGVARQLTETGKLFADAGIGFSFHNHTGSMMGTLDECRRMCDLLDPKICGITYDTAHAAACGMTDLAAAARVLRSHINNVHLKDLNDAGKFCPLGAGKLPLGQIVRTLQEIGFSDWLIVDEESADVACADACRISMEFLKAHGWQ